MQERPSCSPLGPHLFSLSFPSRLQPLCSPSPPAPIAESAGWKGRQRTPKRLWLNSIRKFKAIAVVWSRNTNIEDDTKSCTGHNLGPTVSPSNLCHFQERSRQGGSLGPWQRLLIPLKPGTLADTSQQVAKTMESAHLLDMKVLCTVTLIARL